MTRYTIAFLCILCGIAAGAADIVLSRSYSVQGRDVVMSTTDTIALKVATGDALFGGVESPNGTYAPDGDFNGKPSYKKTAGVAFYIWWGTAASRYFVSLTKDDYTSFWMPADESPEINGTYTAGGAYTTGAVMISDP